MKPLVALLCGIIFGFGLAISGMTDTAKVTAIFATNVPATEAATLIKR
ncbi:MAG: hypothetical protein P8L70_08095 [Halioglobus sp.]|nr:hypothetical protein [Halioglobus sp.]MDG2326677.1 hypothetical protein [Halioglobus sp.]